MTKKDQVKMTWSSLAMGYKKDIFIGLEYDFELLQKMIYRL